MRRHLFVGALNAIALGGLLVSCSGGHTMTPQVPTVSNVQRVPNAGANTTQVRYRLIDIGTFGGPNSDVCVGPSPYCLPPQVLNNEGIVVGSADTTNPDPFAPVCFNAFISQLPPDCSVAHAFEARNGVLTPLGSLSQGSAIAISVSETGFVAGDAQNGEIDPSVPGFPELRAVFWAGGQIVNLGTLGGNESLANAVNNRGDVAGTALNNVSDPFSFIDGFLGASNPTQTRAFLWHDGIMRDLGTLGGPDAFAFYVNERGQVAGYSYINSTANANTGIPTIHPFLWENDRMRDLGTLGGTQVFNIEGLNNRGEVIGLMTRSGEAPAHPFLWNGQRLIDLGTFGGSGGDGGSLNNAGDVVGWGGTTQNCPILEGSGQHPFLWKNGVKIDLGAVPETDNGDASWINSKEQVVGASFSCDASFVSAFLWEKNGGIKDLNLLIPDGSLLHLFLASDINDRGEIAGLASLPNGDIHAYVLIPNAQGQAITAATNFAVSASHKPTGRKLTQVEITRIRAVLTHRHFAFSRVPH